MRLASNIIELKNFICRKKTGCKDCLFGGSCDGTVVSESYICEGHEKKDYNEKEQNELLLFLILIILTNNHFLSKS